MNTFCSLLQHYLRILNYKAISGKVFREADLNVMPICTEGFGLTALEATSTGLPVIVSIFIIFNILQTKFMVSIDTVAT